HHDGSTLQRFSATCHIRPGRLKPDVTLPISAVEISLAWLKALLAAVRIMSSSNWASLALIACGSILIEAIVPSHLATTLTQPPPTEKRVQPGARQGEGDSRALRR